MPYQDGMGVGEKGINSADTSEIEPPVEINLQRALNPLSEEVRENLFDKKEQLGLVGKATPDRRSRIVPARASFDKIVPIALPQSDQSSPSPGVPFLSSRRIWAILDFAVAFWCGSLAILALSLMVPASTSRLHEHLFQAGGV